MKSRSLFESIVSSVAVLAMATGCCAFDPLGINREQEQMRERDEYEKTLPKPDEADIRATVGKMLPGLLGELERADVGSSVVYVENEVARPFLFVANGTSLERLLGDRMNELLASELLKIGKTVRPHSPSLPKASGADPESPSNRKSPAVAGSATAPTGTNGVLSVQEPPVLEPHCRLRCRASVMDEPSRVQYLFQIRLYEGCVTSDSIASARLLWTSTETISKPKPSPDDP